MTNCLECKHPKKEHNWHFFGCVVDIGNNTVCGCEYFKEKEDLKK